MIPYDPAGGADVLALVASLGIEPAAEVPAASGVKPTAKTKAKEKKHQ